MFTFSSLFLDKGVIFTKQFISANRNRYELTENKVVNTVLSVEVDLRSNDASKRTLHFFINNEQYRMYFNELPSKVRFGVWLFF